MQELVIQIEQYIQKHLSEYIAELTTLCAIDSGSYYKPGLDAVACYVSSRLKNIGLDVQIFEHENDGNDVYGIIRGCGQGKVLLLGHIDTVYPVGTATSRPIQIQGNIISGPGVSDMKGGILQQIYTIEALLAANYNKFGEIRVLCVSDEEITDRHSHKYIQQACFGCDAVLVLEAGRENGNIVTARKGGSWYKLKSYGQAAHAGVEPQKGRNAIVELAHQILQFQSLNNWRNGVTISVGTISGGIASNVVADYAEAIFDLRFFDPLDKIETEKLWFEMLQHNIIPDVKLILEVMSDGRDQPMICTSESLRLANSASGIANRLGFSIGFEHTGGASDANHISSYNVPVLDGLGPVGGLDHSPNEYLLANSVPQRSALLAGLISIITA